MTTVKIKQASKQEVDTIYVHDRENKDSLLWVLLAKNDFMPNIENSFHKVKSHIQGPGSNR